MSTNLLFGGDNELLLGLALEQTGGWFGSGVEVGVRVAVAVGVATIMAVQVAVAVYVAH